MNICFIHSRSRIKSPLQVLDAMNQHCMKVGDICMKENEQGMTALLVLPHSNHWGNCKCLGSCSSRTLWTGNSILFSFDGLEQRKGNKKALTALLAHWEGTVVYPLLQNALQILNYEVDYWDLAVLQSCYVLPKATEPQNNQQTIQQTPILAFQTYFDQPMSTLFEELQTQDLTLRQVYSKLREVYPQSFRKALLEFIKENPSRSIYDL